MQPDITKTVIVANPAHRDIHLLMVLRVVLVRVINLVPVILLPMEQIFQTVQLCIIQLIVHITHHVMVAITFRVAAVLIVVVGTIV